MSTARRAVVSQDRGRSRGVTPSSAASLGDVPGAPAGWIIVPGKGALLAPRTVPCAFPSLAHMDSAVENVHARMRSVEGLADGTIAWTAVAYRVFRRFLVSTGEHRTFLSGELEAQMRVLEGWIAWMRDGGRTRVTINNYWRALSLIFARLNQQQGTVNPLVFLPTPKFSPRQARCLTRDAAARVLGFVHHHQWSSRFEQARNFALVGLLLLAGLRRGEAAALKYGHVNLSARTIHIASGKGRYGGKSRTCYMTPQLQDILTAYERERGRRPTSGEAYLLAVRGDGGISGAAIRHLFERISAALDLPVTPHTCRHTYATLLRESGVSDRVAMDLLGHTSLEILQRYSHVFSGEHARAAERLVLDIDSPTASD